MTDDSSISALDEFAVTIATAAGLPWLDQKLIELAMLSSENSDKSGDYLRVVALLTEAKKRLSVQPPVPIAQPPQQVPTAPSPADEQQAYARLVTMVKDEIRTVEHAKSYEQVIVGLGYGALLAIWGVMGPKLNRGEMLVSGSLIGTSLLIYVLFHIFQVLWTVYWQVKQNTVVWKQDSFVDREIEWNNIQLERYKSYGMFLRAWKFIFPVTTFLGVVGAINLILAAVSAVVSAK